jgi:hypothetical protein
MTFNPVPVGNIGVTLESLISGEDPVNNRLSVEFKPSDADATLTTLQNAVNTAVNGTTINLKGIKSLVVEVTGSFTGMTANFEVTIDDSSWVPVGFVPVSNPAGSYVTTATAPGMFTIPNMPAAYSQFRCRTTVSAPTNTMTVKTRVYSR